MKKKRKTNIAIEQIIIIIEVRHDFNNKKKNKNKNSVLNATMTNVTISRMLRGKVRTNTCRIIILTSIVWVLVDVIILMHYVDIFGSNSTGRRSGEYEVEVSFNYFMFMFNVSLDLRCFYFFFSVSFLTLSELSIIMV